MESYTIEDIKDQLNLDRERLVALAVLLGCDYLPKGVPSVGRELAMRFMSALPAIDSVLERLTLRLRSLVHSFIDLSCSE